MADQPPLDMESYLSANSITYQSLTRLSGGNANFVYRLRNAEGHTAIIKHAEPFIASSPNIALSVSRMGFEYTALTTLPQYSFSEDKLIRLPAVHRYDGQANILMLEDGGSRTLKDRYTDPSLDVTEIGSRLGRWLRELHERTRQVDIGVDGNPIAKAIYRYPYQHLSQVALEYDLDPSLGERIDEVYGTLLQSENECVCHGDCWPGNVLLDDSIPPKLTVVDWEMTRRGCGATDVGQFAAEAYLLDTLRGGKGLMTAFLQGYRTSGEINKEFVKRMAVHMGMHLAFWPARVEWGDREATKTMIVQGCEIMQRADSEDWDWLRGTVPIDL